jgi:hypothetical protein
MNPKSTPYTSPVLSSSSPVVSEPTTGRTTSRDCLATKKKLAYKTPNKRFGTRHPFHLARETTKERSISTIGS